MNRNLISVILIMSLMGCAVALDFENGVEMRPGEAVAERLFEKGIGQPWIAGNPPSFDSSDYRSFSYPSRAWGWWYNPFAYYGHQGKTYHPYPYRYYWHPQPYYPQPYYGDYWRYWDSW